MILTRVRIIPQERYDLEDLLAQLSSIRTDSKLYTREFLASENYILKGFKVSGIGLKSATVDVTKGTLINANGSSDFSYFIMDDGTTQITVPDAELEDGVRNYLELELYTESNTPVTKAFWDASANGGAGAEFNQEIDTMEDIQVRVVSSTGGFSGSSDRIKMAIVDVDGSGNITGIRDKRDLFFRLGTGSDPDNLHTWATRTEPSIVMNLSGVTGTYEEGESVSFTSGASALVSVGGTTQIEVQLPDSDSFLAGDTVTGSSSGATGTLTNYEESFIGADKDINDYKGMFNALMTEIREMKGVNYWYEKPSASLQGSFANAAMSVLTGIGQSAKFTWTGTEFLISDNAGVVADSDTIGYLRMFDRDSNYILTRQDNQGGSTGIPVSDGQVVWIQIPDAGNVSYSGVGTGMGNYRVTDRGDVPLDDTTYWLAYREGTRLYLRGLGELETGESQEINDTLAEALEKYLGFDPETATAVPYTQYPNVILGHTFDDQSSLVDAISANTGNINDLGDAINSNVYDEAYKVVATPVASDEIAPQPDGSIISLPLDSRDSNATKFYIVGNGILEVYLNGQLMRLGESYTEVGTAGNPSTQIQLAGRELVEDDTITFRIATVGGFIVTSSGSGLVSLQDAYNTGRLIAVATGQPVQISGPAGEKLLRVLGDVEITGVIDPAGMELTREAVNPLNPLKDGIFVDSNGDLIHSKQGVETNITQASSGQGSSQELADTYQNGTIATIDKATPVGIDASGNLILIDVADEDSVFSMVGVSGESIATGVSGKVSFSGRLQNVSTAITLGKPVYVSKLGIITDVKPSIGVDGFVAGDHIVRVGTIVKNKDVPANKDLLLNYVVVGKL